MSAKDDRDDLERSLEDLGRAIGSDESVVDKVVSRLEDRTVQQSGRLTADRLGRFAAAVLLIVVGYVAGRVSMPQGPDVEQLRAELTDSLRSSLEPEIRKSLAREMDQYWQAALPTVYVQLKEELGRQFRDDLDEYTAQTLTVANGAAYHLVRELVESIDAVQKDDRLWMLTALDQIESNRIQDTTQLRSNLQTFAVRTADEFIRTKEDLINLIAYAYPDTVIPEKSKSPNP